MNIFRDLSISNTVKIEISKLIFNKTVVKENNI